MTAVLSQPRDLIDAAHWERVAGFIMRENGLDRAAADSAVAEGLKFLVRCATTPGPHSPTPEEDTGWHALMLDSRPYMALCDRIAGRYIHHEPTGQGCVDDGGSFCSSKCMSNT